MDKFLQQLSIMRGFLNGRKFFLAAEALQYAYELHNGFRKDGTTPEFSHQIEIGFYLLTLSSDLIYPEETLAAVFLHDVIEDFDIPCFELEKKFGRQLSDACWCLAKKTPRLKKPIETYFKEMVSDPIASVVKGADRIHNYGTMFGVFTIEKQKKYIEEGELFFIPMLKKARKQFPKQEPIYRNEIMFLKSQINMIKNIHFAMANK